MIDNAIIVEIDFPNEIDVDLGEAKFITAPAKQVPQATPEIHISESGLITASATQEEGMVLAGTKSAELQMPTKSGAIIEPSKETQVAIRKGEYAVGDISVNPISDEYIKPSGTLEITENNKEYNVANFEKANVVIPIQNKLAQVASKTVTEIKAEDLEGITKIGQYAFYLCTKLEEVELIEGITEIGNNAFKGCVVKSIVIPDSVTAIGSYVFHACVKLNSIVIGSSVEEIGAFAFQFCPALSITVKAEEPPTIQANTFNNVPADCIIKVRASSVDKYKTATNWSVRADYIVAIEE